MTAPVVFVGEHEKLAAVEQQLVDARITGAPVVDDGRLVGIISRSDFVRLPALLRAMDEYVADRQYERALQQQDRRETRTFRSSLGDLTVGDVMTREVVTCSADASIGDIATRMLNHHVHRVVVIDDDRPIGMIGSLDLLQLLAH